MPVSRMMPFDAIERIKLNRSRVWQTLRAMFLISLALFTAVAARADDTPPSTVSPLTLQLDPIGVNVSDGLFNLHPPSLSIPADPRLSFERVQDAAPYYVGKITVGDSAPSTYAIHYGGESSDEMNCTNDGCTSFNGTGATFNTGTGFYVQSGLGARYAYNLASYDQPGATEVISKYASSITYPDGEVISYTYQTSLQSGITYYRPVKVASNLGFYISITYQSDDFNNAGWSSPNVVGFYNNSDTTHPLEQFTYGAGGTMTDLAGRVFICNCANGLGNPVESAFQTLQLPGESALSVSANARASTSPPLIGSVTKDGVAYTYTYQNLTADTKQLFWHYSGVTVAGPNSYSKTYTMSSFISSSGRRGVVTGVTDELSRHTAVQYDQGQRITSITYPELNSVNVIYDGYGNIVSKVTKAKPSSGVADISESAYVDVNNCGTSYKVLCYRPVWTKDALNRETDFIYNNEGEPTEITEPADASGIRRKTYITYETGPLYRKTVVRVCGLGTTCGTNAESRTEYSYWGSTVLPSEVRRVDAANSVTLATDYTYDNAGRVLSEDGPLAGTGDATYYRYDILGRKTWEIGPAGTGGVRAAKRYTYRDADDKVTRVETGTVPNPTSTTLTVTSQVDMTYDAHRNDIRDLESAGGTNLTATDHSFDDRGEKLCDTVRMNLASLPTDACTLGTQGSFGADRITHDVYDAAGQQLKVQKAYGTSLAQDYVTYTYTLNGKQQYVTDANGNKAQMAYDGDDRLQYWYFPSKTTAGSVNSADYEQYGYDAASNRVSFRKRDGRTFAFTYDGLNRVITKTVPDSCAPIQSGACPGASATRDVYYGYDIRGPQLYARFDSATGDGVTSTYDDFLRLTSSTIKMGSISEALSYAYDVDGNRTRITHPDGIYFTSTYDTADHLLQVLDQSGTQLTLLGYDGLGRRSSDFAGAETYGYDGADRLTSQTVAFGRSYDVARTFGYNPADQIVALTRSNDAYAYTGYTNASRSYATNGLNQYTTAGFATYGYDADGNLISDGTTSYGYDAENRLISSSTGAALVYDPLGRLWQTSGGSAGITQFLYDGDALVAEYNASGAVLRRYVHGADAGDDPIVWYEGSGVTTAQRRLMLADHQGSIDLVIDGSGNQIGINAYDDYGIPKAANIGRFQYTGQAWIPEIGMYYYKARIYAPMLGRFLQTDPIGYKDQINLYAYVANDPVNQEDPTGEAAQDQTDCTGAKLCGGNVGLAPGVSGSSTISPTGSKPVNQPGLLSRVGTAIANHPKTAIGVGAVGIGACIFGGCEALGIGAAVVETEELLGIGTEATESGEVAKGATSLYQKLSAAGEHLKYGITNNPATRYTAKQLAGGRLKILAQGSRSEMLQLERNLHETLPIGPEERQGFYIQRQVGNGLSPPPYNQ